MTKGIICNAGVDDDQFLKTNFRSDIIKSQKSYLLKLFF